MSHSPLRSGLKNSAAGQVSSENNSISTEEISQLIQDWLFDGECRGHTAATIASRRIYTNNLLWFLKNHNKEVCDARAMREFIAYVRTPHEGKWGRIGERHRHQCEKELSPKTVQTYFTNLATFFSWLVKEEVIDVSPMERLSSPIARDSAIEPLNAEQVDSLEKAALRSRYSKRNHALVVLLLDTGLRASELCGIKHEDLDVHYHRVTVFGKGRKWRTVAFGRESARAIWAYLRDKKRRGFDCDDKSPLFVSEGGNTPGQAMQRNGLHYVVEKLGVQAGIQGVRCSPHTLRHTFAVSFLRNGGSLFALQQILGHEDLKMTRKYVRFTQADVESAGREFSPMDAMKRKRS